MPVFPTAGCGLLPSHPSCGGGAQGALGCGRPILCCDSAAPPRAPASGEWVGSFRGGRGHLEVGGVLTMVSHVQLLVRGTVFARMSPPQKQQLVERLQGIG